MISRQDLLDAKAQIAVNTPGASVVCGVMPSPYNDRRESFEWASDGTITFHDLECDDFWLEWFWHYAK